MSLNIRQIICIGLIFGYQCTNNNSSNFNKLNSPLIQTDLNLESWRCELIGIEEFCIPKSWEKIEQEKYLYYCSIDTNDYHSYFVVLKHDKEIQNISFNGYLKAIYNILIKEDSTETAEGYTVKKLKLKKGEAYYCEFYTDIDSIKYITYSMIFQNSHYIYELAIKSKIGNSSNSYNIFQNILFRLKINNKSTFNRMDKIKSIEIIDISKL